MKIIMIECTENELRANIGIMDAIVDTCRRAMDAFYGTYTPCCEEEDESQESEE